MGKSPSAGFAGTFPLKRGRKGLKQTCFLSAFPLKRGENSLCETIPQSKTQRFSTAPFTQGSQGKGQNIRLRQAAEM